MSAIDDVLVDDEAVVKSELRDYLRPYTIVAQYNGTIGASVDVLRIVFAEAVDFAATLPLSRAYADVAASSTATFDIKKNGSSIGSLVWVGGSPSVHTGTFTFASDVSFAAGDRLEITGPASPDALLADITITLIGKR